MGKTFPTPHGNSSLPILITIIVLLVEVRLLLLLWQQRYIEESINITLLYKMIRYLYYRSFLTSSLMYLLFPKGGHSKKEKEKREKRSQSLTFFHHFFLFIAFILKKEFLVGWKRNYGQKFNTLLIESECKTCHWIWFVELPKLSCFLAIAYLDIELNKTSLMWHTEITSIWKKLLMMIRNYSVAASSSTYRNVFFYLLP